MVIFTERAKKEIQRLSAESAENKDLYLRIEVVGGGCSGMQYKLSFDKYGNRNGDSILKDSDDFSCLIDARSGLFLVNTTVDFTDGLNGKGFTFDNPEAKRQCGCGSSFST